MGISHVSIPFAAAEWIVGQDTGASSKALWSHMVGVQKPSTDYPYDMGDFGRCERLLQKVPEWRGRLPEMQKVSPHWARLVANWDSLTEFLKSDTNQGYELMKRILKKANEEAAVEYKARKAAEATSGAIMAAVTNVLDKIPHRVGETLNAAALEEKITDALVALIREIKKDA